MLALDAGQGVTKDADTESVQETWQRVSVRRTGESSMWDMRQEIFNINDAKI